ncbi:MAG: hypothetical protein IJL62_05210 [Clostridia bacterium]|nr:hypothetical protein [Clostridia bacterium]
MYRRVHRLCEAYREDGAAADLSIRITQDDLDYERKCSERSDALTGRAVREPSDRYLEELAVYRKIAEQMPSFDTVLMHGSCIAVDGEAYLFAAKSGTGKSTHTSLWRTLLGDRAVMINDDKPLVRISETGAVVYGTPWDGKHHLSTNGSAPLKAICILERAEKNTVRRITAAEAYPMLLQQIYRPQDAAAMRKTLTLIDRIGGAVDLWRLGCNMDPEAAEIAYHAMSGVTAGD